jgi:hypothetical protein
MRIAVGALAALVLTWSGVAAAQDVNGATIAAQCQAQGAFGQSFGASGVNGQAGMGMMNSQFVTIPAGYAPFTEAEVVFTVRSRVIHTITGMAQFESEAQATEMFGAAVTALRADPRFVTSEQEFEDGIAFYTTGPDAANGLKADISVSGRTITYFCTDLALYRRTFDELAGRDITASTPRPTPPQIALPAVGENVCSNADARTSFLAGFEPQLSQIMGYGGEITRYNETLMHWANAQMIAQGLWTQDESSAFNMALLNNPTFMSRTETSMNAALGMINAVMAYSSATDDATRCARAHDTLTSAHATISSAQAQWAELGRIYQAEAQRRGGTLTLD